MAKVLVTGSNRGIGLQLCNQLGARGDAVIAVCRSISEELSALGVRVIDGIDVSQPADITRLVRTLDGEPIDILVNNAGILRPDGLDSLDYDVMIEQFQVNTLGPLRVTRALLSNLREGSKVVIVTSRVGSIGDNSSGGNYGYRVSKAGANMVGMNLHHDLGPRGIAVGLLHPGLVATEMTHGRGIAPADSARGLIACIDELGPDTSGSFRHAEGYTLPW